MKDRQEELREIYDSMATNALLELYAEGTLTDDAYAVLESVLESRSVPVPDRPKEESHCEERQHRSLWVKNFTAIGIILPIVCIGLDFKPIAIMRICEICWPSSFILLAVEGHFDPAIVLVSVIVNAFIWAGIGWLIGYVTSNGIKQNKR